MFQTVIVNNPIATQLTPFVNSDTLSSWFLNPYGMALVVAFDNCLSSVSQKMFHTNLVHFFPSYGIGHVFKDLYSFW